MKILCTLFLLVTTKLIGLAKNPIIPNKGANDPHINIIDGKSKIRFNGEFVRPAQIEIRLDAPDGKIITSWSLENNDLENNYEFKIPQLRETDNLCFVFKGQGNELLQLDSFSFK